MDMRLCLVCVYVAFLFPAVPPFLAAQTQGLKAFKKTVSMAMCVCVCVRDM